MAASNSTRRPHNFTDLAGQQFGDWTVIRFLDKATSKARWLCRCSCGIERPLGASHLKRGETHRCKSCSARISATRHGMTYSPEHSSWDAMMGRCYRPRDKEYHNYGERGITVCERWHTFENFLADMGSRPDGTTLDRIDNDGNYEPGNVRWSDPVTQGRNRRTNVLLEHGGRTQCLAAWASEIGISIQAIRQRIALGWSVADAVTLPAKR